MKKLITIILAFSTISAGWLSDVENPNGKPGLLTVSFDKPNYKVMDVIYDDNIDFLGIDESESKNVTGSFASAGFTLPISKILTLSYIKYNNTAPNGRIGDWSGRNSHSGQNLGLYQPTDRWKLDIHLPLYKLWD